MGNLILVLSLFIVFRAPAAQYCYDNSQCPAYQTCSGGSSWGSSPGKCSISNGDEDKSSKNKNLIINFYNLAINNHKPAEAAARYIGDQYIQHNPLIGDGKEAFIDFFEDRFKKYPNFHGEIKRIMSDGNLVILHVHSKPEPTSRGRAIVDIFRIDNDKIVEHWDVIQEIPETSANNNGMF
jgi:predicted SnoaL-like aldol condensation-catalyzing enzyme